ncbi:hypothetical protein [Streptomyces sp. CB03911]|uniref:hypothetical protein n=1 Tax=Streptomyces sp. CB03911 TaxID=1804758 RepID=UPI00093EB46A|nr:hypothetical protein [Streptomyces sp. CB03911]OKI16530.1 hypothetical protein A6A07_10995 [Streptomyces sp. CB03911]
MTPEEHLRILGPELLAEIHRRVDLAPPPSPELIDELRTILAPAMRRTRARRATAHHSEIRSAA